jgi:4a-hydroxytetrahydrobiopterin dehydratase
MAELLDEAAIKAALPNLDGWEGNGKGIRREAQAANFPTAIKIVDEVAVAAEEMNHHPDIDIRWRNLFFALSTHDAGGVTDLDLILARRIDEIVRANH